MYWVSQSEFCGSECPTMLVFVEGALFPSSPSLCTATQVTFAVLSLTVTPQKDVLVRII